MIQVLTMSSSEFENGIKDINLLWSLKYNKYIDAFQIIQNGFVFKTVYPKELNCRTLLNIKKDYYLSRNKGNIGYANQIEKENKELEEKKLNNFSDEIHYQTKHHIPQFHAENFIIANNPLAKAE